MIDKASVSLQKYSTLVKLNPNDPDAHFGLAMALEETKDTNEAYKEYEQCIRLNNRYAKARLHIGFLFARADELSRAIEEWLKAFEIDPNLGNMMKDPTEIMYYKKRIEESIAQFQRHIAINSENAYAHYQLGLAYKFFDKPELAIQSLKKAIEINPKLWEAYAKSGDLYYALGQNKYAIMEYQKAISANPKFPDTFLNLGIIYEKENMIALAVKHFERALELDSDNPKIYHGLGRVYYKQGNYKLAMKSYQKSLDLDRKNPEVHYNLAKTCEALYRPDFAIMEYEKAIECDSKYAEAYYQLGSLSMQMGDVKKALDSLENAVRLNPVDAYAHYQLGTAYYRVNDHERAIEHFYQAVNLNPKDAYAFFNLGLAYIQIKQFDNAIEYLKKALEISPGESSYHFNLAIAYSRKNLTEEAMESLKKSIELKPNELAGRFEMARLNKQIGKLDEAIFEYRRIIEIDPMSVEAHYQLGVAFIELEEGDYAYEEFQKAIKIQANHAPSLHGLGIVYARFRKKMEVAMDYYNQSVKADPSYLSVLCEIGDAHLAMNRIHEAIEQYEKIYQLASDDCEVKMKYAYALMKTGKVEKGSGMFRSVINEHPDNDRARFLFGQGYESANEINQAIEQYKAAISINKENAEYHLALARLYHKLEKAELAKQEYYDVLRLDPDNTEAENVLNELFGEKIEAVPGLIRPEKAEKKKPEPVIHKTEKSFDSMEEPMSMGSLMPGLEEDMFTPELKLDDGPTLEAEKNLIPELDLSSGSDTVLSIPDDLGDLEFLILDEEIPIKEDKITDKPEVSKQEILKDKAKMSDIEVKSETTIEPEVKTEIKPEAKTEAKQKDILNILKAEKGEKSETASGIKSQKKTETFKEIKSDIKKKIDPVKLSAEECLDIPMLPDIDMLLDEESDSARINEVIEDIVKEEVKEKKIEASAKKDEIFAVPKSSDLKVNPVIVEAVPFAEKEKPPVDRDFDITIEGLEDVKIVDAPEEGIPVFDEDYILELISEKPVPGGKKIEIESDILPPEPVKKPDKKPDKLPTIESLITVETKPEIVEKEKVDYMVLIKNSADSGKLDKMKEAIKKYKKSRPDDPSVIKNIVDVLVSHNWIEDAVIEYKDYIARFPDNVEFRISLAQLYEKRGKHSLAAVQYQKILAIDHSRDILLKLADAFHAVGDYRGEKANLKEAIDIDPMDTEVWLKYLSLVDENEREDAISLLDEIYNGLFARVDVSEEQKKAFVVKKKKMEELLKRKISSELKKIPAEVEMKTPDAAVKEIEPEEPLIDEVEATEKAVEVLTADLEAEYIVPIEEEITATEEIRKEVSSQAADVILIPEDELSDLIGEEPDYKAKKPAGRSAAEDSEQTPEDELVDDETEGAVSSEDDKERRRKRKKKKRRTHL